MSFVKPIGAENEHPGYASAHAGSTHLVDLLKSIEGGPLREGHDGRRDLRRVRRPVGPRAAARPGRRPAGPHDQHGPGTRIPALVLAPGLKRDFAVDHTPHDTTSILATIEQRFGLKPLQQP